MTLAGEADSGEAVQPARPDASAVSKPPGGLQESLCSVNIAWLKKQGF